MATKFFTNETDNTLLQKIEGVFQYKNIHFFDALVGYFRATGYFHIRPFIEKAQEIRILVGINIDQLVAEAQKNGVLFQADAHLSQQQFFDSLRENIQQATYAKHIEDGMLQFIHDLATGKLQLRVHPKQNIHAKIYIFREQTKHAHGYGSVITGSSNLTDAGLQRNFEFNVELRDDTDIAFATETFDKLWIEGVPVSEAFVEKLKEQTYLNDAFTPYEVYLKFLVEYFGKSIEFDPNSAGDLPKGFKRLSYQTDAVNDGYTKMERHGGFFLSDVVGLGKTIVATLIAKKFYFKNGFPEHRSRTLIVVPPALKGNWEETLDKFGFESYEIITNGSLHKVRNPEKYDLVIVDEAHKFRSDTSDAYNDLQKICKTPARRTLSDGSHPNKKVMLVSATPLNNRPEDVASLVYLFQDSKDSTLEVGNLQHFFRQKIDAYRKAKNDPDMAQTMVAVKLIYTDIRSKVIEPLTVRRTRTDLNAHELYSKDLEAQGILFPDVRGPEKIFYQLDPVLEQLYDQTIFLLTHPTLGLTYNRYRAIGFLTPPKKQKYKKADMIATQLAKIMKTMLVKRIDSSFHAFKSSLGRFLQANQAMITMFEQGRIFIAPNLPVSEYINDGKEDELLDLVLERQLNDPTIEICAPDDFVVGFESGLKQDQDILTQLVTLWEAIGDKDPKLDTFVEYLKNRLFTEINHEKKLVVFSESKETTDYLAKKLPQFISQKILTVDSHTRKDRMPIIRENFDANYTGTKRNDYQVVISTEVLAEGVNLHRANVIVNYDTPWNSTRLMQRIGRVNRIGSVAKEVHIFNFFPTAQVDNDIELQKKALMKLQAFHAALGEDSQIYSPDETPETFGLFDKDPDEEKDEKLEYLMFLRELREKDPDFFRKIQQMPLRARVGRKDKTQRHETISFIRNPKRDAFFYVQANGEVLPLSFLEAVKKFQAKATEKAIALHALHHEQVQAAIVQFQADIKQEAGRQHKIDVTPGPNEKKAQEYLNGFLNVPHLGQDEKTLILLAKEALQKGWYQNLQRDINKLQKNQKTVKLKLSVLLDELLKILHGYNLQTRQTPTAKVTATPKDLVPKIIISESFDA
ncbi:MAG: phospholipase D-like domain-containing protein [Bacteroidetes bacterium]|nr:phospholipase D-like domain-containing protein [Bacteroidota bacterium]